MQVTRHRQHRQIVLLAACALLSASTKTTLAVEPQVLFAFQGKGSALAFDLGVVSRLARDIPALHENRVIVAGSSGGSILAVYFACFGFSDETIDRATHKIKAIDVSPIHSNEQLLTKMRRLVLNEHTEIPPEALNESIAFALGCEYQPADDLAAIVARSTCRPRLPLLIVAANSEVLANRRGDSATVGRWEKSFDRDNYDVSWKDGIAEFYRAHPDAFATNALDLRLGATSRIGKAATYFVDRTIFDLLSRIPADERLADLRLVETPADLALAIRASAAEPTYFDPVVETEPTKLSTGGELGDLGNSVQRSYCGGFIMPLPAQDARRAMPSLHVVGTSCVALPPSARTLVETWYLVDTQPLMYQCNWWSDFDTSAHEAEKRRLAAHRLSPDDEWELGRATAAECLGRGQSAPNFTMRPKFTTAIGAPSTVSAPLPTRRGLQGLLSTSERASR